MNHTREVGAVRMGEVSAELKGFRIPSPLAGEGGPRSGSGEGLKSRTAAAAVGWARADRMINPSSVSFADTFSRKGRRGKENIRQG
jgi:hypothetical protein